MIITGKYDVRIECHDGGCGVSSILIKLDREIDSITKNDLIIEETKQITDFTSKDFPVVTTTTKRTIESVTLVDQNSKEVVGPSQYVLVSMTNSPIEGSILLFSMKTLFNTYSNPYYITINKASDAIVYSNNEVVDSFKIDTVIDEQTSDADKLKLDVFEASNKQQYQYATYTPSVESDTLVVWLHGMGEGGTVDTDPILACTANKVVSLTQDKFQTIMNGAHILAPQCPTFWMDGTGEGLGTKGIVADGTSYYTESLHELILAYKEDIGAKRVIITGCSNGGYMTLLLALTYTDEFDAYVPICEAINDKDISDQQLKGIKDLPIYFIYSLDDTTVDPTIHEIPTINRLKAMKASNLKVAEFESVVDTSRKFDYINNCQYVYSGHWSWIYFFNNEVIDDNGETIWEWMAKQ